MLVGCSGAVADEPDVTGYYAITITSTCNPSRAVPAKVWRQPDGRIGMAHIRLQNNPCVGELVGERWTAECDGERYELDFKGGKVTGTVTYQGCVSQVSGERED